MERKKEREKKEGGRRGEEGWMVGKRMCWETNVWFSKRNPVICLAHIQLFFLDSKNLQSICYCQILCQELENISIFQWGTLTFL